jgi:hypothetical protein
MRPFDKYNDTINLIDAYNKVTLLSEANLSNEQDLMSAIDGVMQYKEVDRNSPIYKWFTTQFVKWYKSSDDDQSKDIKPHSYKEGEPEWMSRENISDFTGFSSKTKDDMLHIVDYFNTLNERDLGKIGKVPYAEVTRQVKEWDSKRGKTTGKKKDNPLQEGTDFKYLGKTYKSSEGEPLRIVQLLTMPAFKFEGEVMQHCVKDGGYKPTSHRIFSLYDSKNMPHVTLEVGKSKNEIKQIKGKQNREPDMKYQEATKQMIRDLIGQGYIVTGDGENVDMIKYDNKYFFEDDSEWQDIFETKVKPRQEKALAELKARIVTV